MANKHVLIIDDDTDLTQLLHDYLTSNEFDVSIANDGQEGLDLAIKSDFDVILLDVMLPTLNGFEVLQQLRLSKSTPVIMLTAKGEDFDRIYGLEVGADDYIPKPFNHRELLARVKAMVRRIDLMSQPSHQHHILFEDITLNNQNRTVKVNEADINLTGTEFEILTLLLKEPLEIVSKEAISQQVLGRKLAPYDRSIDMHVSNIRKKIAEFSEYERIKTVRGAGYVMVGN
ncbi:response regulator transcription factor [Psychrosphaera ytuae]|uniref:Response regulator transcription factor n=1 Tax=Psychrosphaera ytuae TaxID=2820710 RepID=A0A975D905_9GAMM|nr:response regulator transcription factor [Psychrosphaera ytuae]QTH62795.1 response regulator transcription factor [Psychrosphaera ytuae]